MKTALIIPVFNNEWSVKPLAQEVSRHIDPEDIIVVDDGSTDKTSAELSGISGISVLRHERNLGKGRALETGLGEALKRGYDWVITMDGDGQHSAEDLPKFLEENTGDVLLGVRDINIRNMPFFRILSNKITSFILSWLSGQKILDSQCGFRKIRAEVIRKIKVKSGRFQYESEFLLEAARNGFKIGHVPIRTLYNSRLSSMRHLKDTWGFVRLVLRYLISWS